MDDNIVGKGFQIDDLDEFVELLYSVGKKPEMMIEMRRSCLKKAEFFTVKQVIKDSIKIERESAT